MREELLMSDKKKEVVYKNGMDIRELPSTTTLKLKVWSKVYYAWFEGEFKVKRRGPEEFQTIATSLAEIMGGKQFTSDNHAALMNALIELRCVIIDSPSWWQSIIDNLDSSVILAVYAQYVTWINDPFRQERQETQSTE